jgi:hypothetical protein
MGGEKGSISMMKRVAIAGIVALTIIRANATDKIGAGPGIRTCVEFANDIRANLSNEEIHNSWVLGFMTGMNVAVQHFKKPTRDLEGIPFEKKKDFIRTFCRLHPEATVLEGAVELFAKLPFAK